MAKDAGVRSVSELRTFGQQLQILSTRTNEIFHDAQYKMSHVSEGWNDSQQTKFAEEFSIYVKQIEKIASRMSEHAQYIQRQCDRLENYLNGR